MTKQLEVLITSGGTISRIDDVRHIGNNSKGTTGAMIAEEFLRKGAKVHFLHRKGSVAPFSRSLVIDKDKPLEQELERVKPVHEQFQELKENYLSYSFDTFESYQNSVKHLLELKPDVVVLAAAVSDYGAKKVEGKISSDRDNLSIELEKTPKIISLVKQWQPHVFQVGFKLLSKVSPDKLIETAYAHGIKNHSDLTVANDEKLNTFLITPEKGIIPVKRNNLAEDIVNTVNKRLSDNHYRTELVKDTSYLEKYKPEIEKFRENVNKFWNLNLFEQYYPGSKGQFGFVAMRLPEGFLITARASNKKNLELEDIIYVPQVDWEKQVITAHSSGKKASLNANVAAKIFKEREDANIILHSHIFPGFQSTEKDFQPGTQEDLDEIMGHLKGSNALELKNHGMVMFGKNLEKLTEALDSQVYSRFPGFYDIVYKRFQESSDFVNLVSQEVKKDSQLLDLAGGTGDLSEKLIEAGYRNISVADKSIAMLSAAKKKLGNNASYYHSSMEDLNQEEKFDAILVRQAINYAMDYQNLVKDLKNIHGHLKPEGKLIFNAPNYSGNKYQEREHEYDKEGWHVKVREMNVQENSRLIHTQNCILTKSNEVKKIYDLNTFGLFTQQDFKKALNEAGFHQVDVIEKPKSLYCIASQ